MLFIVSSSLTYLRVGVDGFSYTMHVVFVDGFLYATHICMHGSVTFHMGLSAFIRKVNKIGRHSQKELAVDMLFSSSSNMLCPAIMFPISLLEITCYNDKL